MKRLRRLAGAVLFPLIGYRPQQVDAGTWDREYRDGAWDYLAGIDSVAGLAAVMGYCQHLNPASILDAGCGEGLLAEKLRLLDYEYYLGIDLSQEAIARATQKLGSARTEFAVADLHRFESPRRFDVIIFNQSLYYLSEPDAVLARYAAMLAPGGHFIISMADQPRTRALWPLAEKVLRVEDEMDTRQGKGRVITKLFV
ncbi:MAG TPA: class I SAM-dependent methyltransferase [Rhizomicrobium sp.]|nr:class I SAM-dependent methyltransferase [Rhizomicrobium sp.]